IAFEFVVSLRETLSDLGAWEKDGMTFRPLEQASGKLAEATALSAPISSAPEAEHNPFVAPSHVVRVDLSRLDDLMRITGELVIHRARLEDQINRVAGWDAGIDTH